MRYIKIFTIIITIKNVIDMKPTLNFVEAIKACFAKYATFSGRARRSEFWWFYLLCMIPSAGMSFLMQWKTAKAASLQAEMFANLDRMNDIVAQAESVDTTFGIGMAIFGILSLALFIPMLAAWVRRLHDVGKSGHMIWLILLCGVGGLIPLVMAIPDGQRGPNKYGDDPKADGMPPVAGTPIQTPPVV